MKIERIRCGRARRLLWPDAGLRPASPDVIEAREHVAGCAACQRFIDEMRGLGEQIRQNAPRTRAPTAVRDRLFSAIARARAGREARSRWDRKLWGAVAAAAVIVLAIGMVIERSRRETRHDPIAGVALDHVRAVSDARIASTAPHEIAGWLSSRIHFGVYVPVLPGAALRGGRLCVLEGRRCAAIEYDVNGVAMTYFVIPDDPRPADAAAMHFDIATRSGYRVVWWREPGLLHAMVGDLPASQLQDLAKSCVEQAQRAIALRSPPMLPNREEV